MKSFRLGKRTLTLLEDYFLLLNLRDKKLRYANFKLADIYIPTRYFAIEQETF